MRRCLSGRLVFMASLPVVALYTGEIYCRTTAVLFCITAVVGTQLATRLKLCIVISSGRLHVKGVRDLTLITSSFSLCRR